MDERQDVKLNGRISIVIRKDFSSLDSAGIVGIPYKIFIKAVNQVFDIVIDKGSKKAMKNYKTIRGDNMITFYDESDDMNYLLEQRKQIEDFLLEDEKEFMKDERVKKVVSNRIVANVMLKLGKMVLGGKTVMGFLNRMCILVTFRLETFK
jgi:hypothetical protein